MEEGGELLMEEGGGHNCPVERGCKGLKEGRRRQEGEEGGRPDCSWKSRGSK